jgi:HEAT repeat protein
MQTAKLDGDAAWDALRDDDAAWAFKAMARLDASPAAAVGLLRERLKPVSAARSERIARLVGQLDDDDFEKREEASRELGKLGASAEPALRKAVQSSPSAEVLRRAEELLKMMRDGPTSGDHLREVRAVEVLEGLGTPEAKKLLEELANGAPEAPLTREAKASLGRLANRP